MRKFGIDDLDVTRGVDLAGHMDDVVILEATHHMRDRIDFADVCKKFIAKPSPFEAPATSPAISTNSTVVGRIRSGCTISASFSSRGSGTGTTPTLGSMVQKG